MLLAVCINPYFDSPAAISTWQALHLVPLSFTATASHGSLRLLSQAEASEGFQQASRLCSQQQGGAGCFDSCPYSSGDQKAVIKNSGLFAACPCRGHQSSTEITGRCPWGLPQSSAPLCHAQDNPTVVSAHALCHTLLPRVCLVGFHTLFVFRLILQSFRGRSSSFGQHLQI